MLDTPLTNKHSPGIELLRGVFCLWVLFAHLVQWTQIVQGMHAISENLSWGMSKLILIFQSSGETHPAVIGFVVLSGFCIHRNGLRNSHYDIKNYALRRIFRILPVFVAANLLGIIYYSLSSSWNKDLVRDLTLTNDISIPYVAAKLSGISAFIPSLHENTFQGNAPLHTVMVEMWLYVAYPILFKLMLHKKSERPLWLIVLTVWLCGVIGMKVFPWLLPWWNNGSFLGFLLFWWIGAKCISDNFVKKITSFIYPLMGIWILLTLVIVMNWSHSALLLEMRKALLALFFGIFFNKIQSINSLAFKFAWIGKPSYSLYAIHAPCSQLLLLLGLGFAPTVAITLGIGFIMFNFYEAPWIEFGRKMIHTKKSPAAL